MRFVELSELRNQAYSLRSVIGHMQFWGNNSNWIIPEGGRINTAIMIILSLEADFLNVDDHSILISAKSGDLIIIPQGARYEFFARSSGDISKMLSNIPSNNYYFHGIKMEDWPQNRVANVVLLGFELIDQEGLPFTLNQQITVLRFLQQEELFRRAIQIARMYSSLLTAPAITSAKLYELLTMISEAAFNLHPRFIGYQRIEAALRALDENPIGSISVQELSEICNLSVSGFRRLFHREMGMSPCDYLMKRKLQRAEDLLLISNMSIEEVAHECGFQDEFYFSRFFRKKKGIPPLLWRKEKQELEIRHDK